MPSRHHVRAGVAVAVWLGCLALYFRVPLLSGFAYSFGDRGDAIIELAILEHWRNVWLGVSPWWQTFYFHPYPATLGYNDGYFVSGVLYALFRILAGPVGAVLLVASAYRSIAFWSCYWLLTRFLGARWEWALTGAAIFTIANTQYLQAIHGQFQAQALLPLLAGTAWQALRYARADQAQRASLLGAAFAALLGLLLWTGFYLGWFVLLFGFLLLASSAIELKDLGSAGRHRLFRQFRWPLLAAGLVLVAAALPMLWLYLPKLTETGGHNAGAVHYYLVKFPDLISPGRGNWLWGFIQEWAWSFSTDPARNTDPEFWVGQPLVFLSLLLAALIAIFAGFRRIPRENPLLLPLAVSLILAVLLTIDLGTSSLWHLTSIFPGANGVRVVSRLHLFLILPALVLITLAFRDIIAGLWQNYALAALALSSILVIEQLNSENVARLERRSVEQMLALPRPPAPCGAFAVISSRQGEGLFVSPRINSLYPHNVDAMLLAEWWRRPTVNGFSTFNPPDWNFADPGAADYRDRVLAYAISHRLGPICFLDARQHPVWTW